MEKIFLSLSYVLYYVRYGRHHHQFIYVCILLCLRVVVVIVVVDYRICVYSICLSVIIKQLSDRPAVGVGGGAGGGCGVTRVLFLLSNAIRCWMDGLIQLISIY